LKPSMPLTTRPWYGLRAEKWPAFCTKAFILEP
jgi:hypothetical protein